MWYDDESSSGVSYRRVNALEHMCRTGKFAITAGLSCEEDTPRGRARRPLELIGDEGIQRGGR